MSSRLKKQCLFCKKKLENATPPEIKTFQPYDGGEVFFQFCYGSRKFDRNIHTTRFLAYICDDCAEQYVPRMKELP